MRTTRMILATVAILGLSTMAVANPRHHRHDCGWGRHHHLRC